VRIFEDAFGKKFSVIEIPEAALEAQWTSAPNPWDKTFAALMLGVARGLGSGMKPPFEKFPMRMTSAGEYVRNMARASGQVNRGEHRESSQTDATPERGAELM
jgi:hypothetical protein